MANIKISELNGLTKKDYDDLVPIVDVSANETKKVSIEELIDNNVELIAVSGTAPSQCSAGDKYYNTTTNKIYTATDTNTWGTTGENAIQGIFYIVFDKQDTYAYDGTELVSVGGGSGGETLPVGAIVDYDGTDIPTGWEEVNDYSTSEVNTGKKWIDGKPIYRKCLNYTGNIANGTNVQHGITNLDKMIKLYGYFVNNDSQGLLPFNNKNTDYIIDFDNITSTKFTWSVGSGFNLINVPIVVVMEYTKTTD